MDNDEGDDVGGTAAERPLTLGIILTQGPGPLGGAEGGGDDILVSRIVKKFVDALEGVEA